MTQGLLQLATTGTVSGLQNNQAANTALAALAGMIQGGSAPTPASTGLASTSGVWWHDTTNNQVKLRDQADANWILVGTVDETNKLFYPSNSQAVGNTFKGLKVTVGSNTQFTVTADELVTEDNSGNAIRLRSVNVTINLGSSGANGLDTGVQAANTWYSGWVIYNPATQAIAGLASLSTTAPTMPSGYTHKARATWVRSDGSTHLWRIIQYGRRAQIIVDGTELTALPQMASGAAGNPVTPTWVAVATGNVVPPTAARILGLLYINNSQGIVAPNNNYGGDTSASNPPPVASDTTSQQVTPFDFALESSNIYWASAAGTSQVLMASGWEDNF